MKQLLFVASLALCLLGCGRSTEKTMVTDSSQPIKTGPALKAEVFPKTDSVGADSNETQETGIKNAPVDRSGDSKRPGEGEIADDKSEKMVIRHSSPERSKIDSIKAAKQKLKK